MVIEIGAGNVRERKEVQILSRSSVGRVGKRGNCEGGLGLGARVCILEVGDKEMEDWMEDVRSWMWSLE